MLGGALGWAAFVQSGIAFSARLWGPTEQWAGIIWGGILLSMITAHMGGASAKPAVQAGVQPEQEAPGTPLRRAS